MPPLYTPNGDFSFGVAEWKPDTDIVAINTAIRKMPGVVAYVQQKANELVTLTESHNFMASEVHLSGSRARVYVGPRNKLGGVLEASEGVLTKAAVMMSGR